MGRMRRAWSLAWEAPQTALGVAHELGHTKQSRLLGPLYLPVVGLPSISRAAYALVHREVTGKQWTGYYEGYPENWADRLGGVCRERGRL